MAVLKKIARIVAKLTPKAVDILDALFDGKDEEEIEAMLEDMQRNPAKRSTPEDVWPKR